MNTLRNAAEVEAKVAVRIGRQLREFGLLVRGTGLVLQGRCRTYHPKQLVLQAVIEVTDVPIVANEITV